MSVNVNREVCVFLVSFLCGIICSVLFDLFRASRSVYRQSAVIIGLSDLFFWLVSCTLCYACIFVFNNGKLRFYEFAAVILGSFIYFLTLSTVVKYIFVNFFKIIRFIFKILLTPAHFLYKMLIAVFLKIKAAICVK